MLYYRVKREQTLPYKPRIRIMNLKYVLLLPLIAFVPESFAPYTPQQKDPFTAGITAVFNFYGPHKAKLRVVRENLQTLEQKIASFEKNPKNPREPKAINDIIGQITQDLEKIAFHKVAIDHCPTFLKNIHIRDKLKQTAEHFMNREQPELLQVKAQELLERAQKLLQ